MSESAIEAGKAFLRLLIDNKELQPGLDSSLAQLKAFSKSALSIGSELGGIGAAISAPFLVGLHTFSETGDELEKMSQRTGIAASALSEFKFAAEHSGTDLSGFEVALRKMQKTLGDAENGSDKAAAKITGIGLSVNQLAALGPDEQFSRIAKKISEIPDPTLRAAAAMAIFGKAGTIILPMAEHLDELQKKAEDAAVTMSDEAAKDAEKLHAALKLVREQTVAVSNALGAALAPAVTALLGPVSSAIASVIEFAKNNRALITALGILGFSLVTVGGFLVAVGLAGQAAAGGIVALRVALAALEKNPLLLAISVGFAVLSVLLGPLIDKMLGLGDAQDAAAKSAKRGAAANLDLADSHGKVNKKLDERVEAMARLNRLELEWLGIAERQKARNDVNKRANDLRVQGIDEETRSVDESTKIQIQELERLQEVKKRLFRESQEGGSQKFKDRVIQQQGLVDNEIAATRAEIERLQAERQALIDKRDAITGKTAEDQEKAAKKLEDDIKEKQEQRAKEQKKLQEELADQALKDEEKRLQLQRSVSQTVAQQFGRAARETRGGFGGQLAELIAGRTGADSTEVRMLELTAKQLTELQKLNAKLGVAGILVFGAE